MLDTAITAEPPRIVPTQRQKTTPRWREIPTDGVAASAREAERLKEDSETFAIVQKMCDGVQRACIAIESAMLEPPSVLQQIVSALSNAGSIDFTDDEIWNVQEQLDDIRYRLNCVLLAVQQAIGEGMGHLRIIFGTMNLLHEMTCEMDDIIYRKDLSPTLMRSA